MGTKISAYTALGAAPATNDLIPMVDVSDNSQAASGTTKNMTVANLFTGPAFSSAQIDGGDATKGKMVISTLNESLTLNTGATSTATAGNLAPANARILAILVRVTTTITTSVSYTVKITGGNVWKDYAGGSTTLTGMAANQTYVLWPNAFGDDLNAAAATLTITLNANPGAGVVEFTTISQVFTAPTA